ncbi:hypothetical protein DCC81_20795 [Chitinophaga parva]|uniref:Lipocalin-like domain-containing protein n=1 Tax=Chitinophaga parva TaxID=2169414 RepID=A0A2T7BCN7_9BACT|nr:hypothetical protein [Chitinophaga parva]PUZ22861.1 hypothetical protein DCC81_20795 [Chitinophaga parva]
MINIGKGQQVSTGADLTGNWRLARMEYLVLPEKSETPLERKTVAVPDSQFLAHDFLPLLFVFRDSACVIRYSGGTESGTYQARNTELVFKNAQATGHHARAFFTYRIQDGRVLILSNDGVNHYQDSVRKVPVRMRYTAYYIKGS